MSIMEKLQEMSETVEKLSAQLTDLKDDIYDQENSERVETMNAAVESIKGTIEAFKPYQH